jgi:hypothetical protein
MRNLVLPMTILTVLCLIACGPTAKDIEEKRIADSLRVTDSLAMVKTTQQKVSDSISNSSSTQHLTVTNIPFSVTPIDQKLGERGLYFNYNIANNLFSTFSELDVATCLHVVYANDEISDKCAQWDDPANSWKFVNIKSHKSAINKGFIYLLCDLKRTPKEVDLFFTIDAISIDCEFKDDTIEAFDLLPLWKEAQIKAGLR